MNPVVFVVEDHVVLRGSLHDWLETVVPGVSVLCAASVEEALDTLAHAIADVVLMDIGLVLGRQAGVQLPSERG